ncbi:hypothetical protein FRC14_006904 [Serendipita sp. 396]|nr:hypothetical protein FRC14_006904 [Serendipita sp. 396]KAG8777775.1 hypothetical protein FRC15_011120 [Serendipita sp. 397]
MRFSTVLSIIASLALVSRALPLLGKEEIEDNFGTLLDEEFQDPDDKVPERKIFVVPR